MPNFHRGCIVDSWWRRGIPQSIDGVARGGRGEHFGGGGGEHIGGCGGGCVGGEGGAGGGEAPTPGIEGLRSSLVRTLQGYN